MTVAGDTEVSVSFLSEMLRSSSGLSSGYLSSTEALHVLDIAKTVTLFRKR
jgi:hypothetical protein